MAGEAAGQPTTGKRHRYWDKVVSAAYLRMIGHTQEEAAGGVGRAVRTIQLWEADATLWKGARQEAADRWLAEVTDASRQSVLKAAARNADLAFRVLERVDPALAPPKQKLEHSGEVKGGVLVVPAPVATEDWVAAAEAQQRDIARHREG